MEPLSYCCGVGETGDFGVPSDYDDMIGAVADAKDMLQVDMRLARNSGKKLLVATTSSRQPHAIRALKSLRFKKVSTFRGHEGIVTLWLKKLRA